MPRRRVDPPAADAGNHDQLAHRVRFARLEKGLSTRTLAAGAGVSQSLISQIERGECEPSLATLRSIAATLQLSPNDLLGRQGLAQIEITRSGDKQIAFSDSPGNVTGRRLINQPNALLEAYQLTISGGGDNEWFSHAGDEIVLVHTGTLEVQFGGHETATVSAGDSLYYPGEIAHMWRNPSDDPTTVTHIVSSGAHHSAE